FYMLQLAPDNRIYVSNYDGNNRLHYIEFPDSGGTACNVVQNTFITPGYNTFSFPNIVNYDLMNDTTSACDTVLLFHPSQLYRNDIRIFPNPAKDFFWVNYSLSANENVTMEIYDAIGNKVQQHILYGHSKTLLVHTEKLRSGIYFYSINSHQQKVSTGKIVILK
ncbi:MAG: T9SS type A sorting domain-containing protein, partial [Bacteroidetes bacterium]|nr:T9SS type A sorting domain-containing protein [Bacteroidota bacterium]